MKDIYMCVFATGSALAILFSLYAGVLSVCTLARAYHQRRGHGVSEFSEGLLHAVITACGVAVAFLFAKLTVALYLL